MSDGNESAGTGNEGGTSLNLSEGAGNSAGTDASASNGSTGGEATPFFDGLSEGNRQKATDVGWKSPDQVVEAFTNLESKLGNSVQLPGADASPEDWGKLYDRLGRPSAPDAYEFAMPENLPESMPYDKTLSAEFKNWAHEGGLNAKQANFMHGKFVEHQAASFNNAAGDAQKSMNTAHGELVTAWGPPEGAKHTESMQHAVRALQNLDMVDAFVEAGFIDKSGTVYNSKAVMKMAEVGAAMFPEGDTIGTGAPNTTNPFKGDNMTEQGKVIRDDPERARALIRNAGKNPADYGFA